jgi:UDP-glucuronate 4-epimerase
MTSPIFNGAVLVPLASPSVACRVPRRRIAVTGAAGFIGSATVREFLNAGYQVRGIDRFTDYYQRERKERNVAELNDPQFEFVEAAPTPLNACDLFDGVDAIVHLAGQPGVRGSWERFDTYVENNIVLTHTVLQAANALGIERVVYASSSSVYGTDAPVPTTESDRPRPSSAYGMSKYAGEQLCEVASQQFGLSTVSMRYFTVYGPRQRPDMAIGRIIAAAVDGSVFTLFGDGTQVRDFTFVRDVARANRLAVETASVPAGTAINIAGGSATTLRDVVDTIASVLGRDIAIDMQAVAAGDVRRTDADTARARDLLGWTPNIDLRTGIEEHVRWYESEFAAAI